MALAEHLAGLGADLKQALKEARFVNAQPEEQLKAPVTRFVNAIASDFGFATSIRPEARAAESGTRPDLAVLVAGSRIGDIELKSPGKGARPDLLKDPHDKEQWRRLQDHPNLIYTDGNEWALYRSGERVGEVVRASGDAAVDGAAAFERTDLWSTELLFREFLSWNPIVPSSPKGLAELLAPLCRLLRAEVLAAMLNPDSMLVQVARDWRQVLFPDADDAQFADAYAQTLTYALLLARLEGERDLRISVAAESLASGHALLGQALAALANNDARDEISFSVELLQRTVAAVDPARLKTKGSDPWLYFYEDFLSAYDPKLRRDRGVYYTPVEVVRAQVRLVASILRDRFDRPLSFAEKGVSFLDPAVGTGTYPLAAVEHALAEVRRLEGAGMCPQRATVLGQNIHAFELLVGPYAVAHLRITQGIEGAGGRIPPGGVQVYLTDTLESPHQREEEWHVAFARQLSDEYRKAVAVKSRTAILVCMGNPPYDRQTINPEDRETVHRKGGWVRFGDGERTLLADFIDPLKAEDRVHAKNLYNDYVYFWRWALWKVFETEVPGPGVLSFITAASYLRGPWAKAMREHMRRTFDELWIIDLEGGSLGPRKTENVFNIQNPVAIAIGVRYGAADSEHPATVSYTKVTGTRDEKLTLLDHISAFGDLEWQPCGKDWQDPFIPEGSGNFFAYPELTAVFPWQHAGVQAKRAWVIGSTPDTLERRWSAFLAADGPSRASLAFETRDRKVDRSYADVFDPGRRATPLKDELKGTPPRPLVPYAYRVLDTEWLLTDSRLVDYARPALWSAHSDRQVYMASLLNTPLGDGPAVFAAADIPDMHFFRGSYGGKDILPLWRDAAATEPNVNVELVRRLAKRLGREVEPEDLFAYAYGVLCSPAYTSAFSEELLLSVPRLPITVDADLFKEMAALGRTMLNLHTRGQRFGVPGQPCSVSPGKAQVVNPIGESAERYPEEYAYDDQAGRLFFGNGQIAPVAEAVWDYSVSGYRVLESWLKSHRRTGSGRHSSALDEIRPQTWTMELNRELLELIWILEQTVALAPAQATLLQRILSGGTLEPEDAPEPRPAEASPPEPIGFGQKTLFGEEQLQIGD